MRTPFERIEALVAMADEEAHPEDWLPMWQPIATEQELDALIDEWERDRARRQAA